MYAELTGDSKKQRIKSLYDNKLFQEYGTRYQSGTPFMRPALNFIYPQFQKDMIDVMKGVLK